MSTLNIICALSCEAKALVNTLKLKKDISVPQFQCYKNQNSTLQLIVSGIGKINAAVATAFVATQVQDNTQAFLNVGIAGCQQHAIGSALLADKLVDNASQYRIYPKVNLIKKLETETLITFDQPCKDYSNKAMQDMEAFGFYQAALKFTSQEFIQVLKVISDTTEAEQKKIDEKMVQDLMGKNTEKILSVIQDIQALQKIYEKDSRIKNLDELGAFHFTEQQKIQAQRLLSRAEAFNLCPTIIAGKVKTSKEFIRELEQRLEVCY